MVVYSKGLMMRMRTYTNGGYGVKGIDPAGGTMTLPLRLVLTPGTPMDAVTKGYVDNAASSFTGSTVLGTFNSARLPGWSGSDISSAGGVFTLSTTGVTAGTYSKVTVDDRGRVTAGGSLTTADVPDLSWSKIIGKPSTLAGYGITDVVSLNGGTMTGALTLGASVTGSTQLATKAYVDITIGNSGSSPFVVGDIVYKSTAVTPSGFLRCNGGAVSKTTYAGLYSVLGNTYTPEYVQPGAGQPWRQQYDINTEQSGDITGWTTGTSLPNFNYRAQVVVTKNKVYLLGGNNALSNTAEVVVASINTDGTLGTWTTSVALPASIANAQVIVTKNRVYILGGIVNGVFASTVYTAVINSDGTLGTWVTGTSLPTTIGYAQAIVTKNRVYLIGGIGTSVYTVATVYTAPINTDGTLGTWSAGTSLPETIGRSQAIVTKNRVYLLGGITDGGSRDSTYNALINTDGTIGTWTTGGTLPAGVYHSQAVVTKNRVYLLGGMINGTTSLTVYTAAINTDGTVGTWVAGTSLPGTVDETQVVVTKGRIHLIGGWKGGHSNTVYTAPISGGLNDYSPYYDGTYTPPGSLVDANYVMPGSGQPWKQQYDINTTQSGDITGGWIKGVDLRSITAEAVAVVTKNRVYLLGGRGNASYYDTVLMAPVNTDGSLGVWSYSSPLPSLVSTSQAIVVKNKLHLIGGRNGGSYSTSTHTSTINTDGTLGAWTTSNSLPSIVARHQAVVTINRIYLLGGFNGGSYTDAVYTAPINTDGTLGTWVATTALPVATGDAQAIVTKNRVYLLGGRNNSSYLGTVYTAPINTDGTLGAWSSTSSLPTILSEFQAVVTRYKVYILGGLAGDDSSAVYTAPINSDGTLGAWVTGASLPAAVWASQAVVTNNRVHLLGGCVDGSFSGNTYTAPISEGLNDYSPYYDGTVQPATLTYTSADNFNLPDLTTKDKPGSYSYIKY